MTKTIHPISALLLLACWLVGGFAFAQDDADVTIVMDNERADAWFVLSVDGADGVVELEALNPTITLEVGVRYNFDLNEVNNVFHPLDFRDAEGNFLLAQGPDRGSFEGDEAVAFSTDEDHFTFTLTPELAQAMATYHCTVHVPMVGEVVITGL